MRVSVRLFTTLRELVGKRRVELQLPNGATVQTLLDRLSELYGHSFTSYIYDEEGKLRNYLQLLLNGENIRNLGGLQTRLKEGDTLIILPPAGGG